MLIRFVVNNFLSFNEEKEFNMIAGSFKTHKHHVYNVGKVNVLKSAAIYGANGAGKSNLIKAIDFLQSSIDIGEIFYPIQDKKFKMNKGNIDKPSTFEIEFSVDKKIYAYGLSVNHNIVTEEWLYETVINSDSKMIFERTQGKNGKTIIKLADKYKKSKKSELLIELMEDNLLKSNELLIGKTENLKIDEITRVRDWLQNGIFIIYPGSKFQGLVPFITSSQKFRDFACGLLETFDTGVSELAIKSTDFEKHFGKDDEEFKKELIEALEKNKNVLFNSKHGDLIAAKENGKYIVKNLISYHKDLVGHNVSFDLSEESDGTQRLLDFIPALYRILSDDVTFIIDEIDQSLHPALLRSLINKIMSDSSTKGQFIFSTHESNLLDLDIFRQDEIWFVEKDKKSNETQLYSLSDFKPRYDLDIRKGYLNGRFGAIPFLANLEDLNWHKNGL
jgi:AAA15 family ATPase/GTPase